MTVMERPVVARWPYAVGGLLSAAAGMGAAHLVAAFVNPAASPVVAVGSTVVDSTPTPVKEWAVHTFGTADKPVLLTAVAVVTALAAAGAGLAARRRPGLGNAVLLVLATLAAAAALTRPAALPQDVTPSLVAALVGVLVLAWLRRLAARAAADDTPGAARAAGADPAAHGSPAGGTASRRGFLLGGAGVAAGAAAAGALGQRIGTPPTLPSAITLPAPSQALPPLPTGLEAKIKGLSPFRTPANRFYRVDTALVIPRVDVDGWTLEVRGQVDQPFTLTFADLLKMPMVEKDITLNCVSNEVGGPYISSTRWLGVRVSDLLRTARLQSGPDQILSESTDGMTISTPVEALTDDREALVAVAMDGRPLPAAHGFPARLVTPGLYGYVGATKWLARLTATSYAARQAYWTQRGWAAQATVKTQSRIDTPDDNGSYPPGKLAVAGVAWAQGRGISAVEVQVDDGPWQRATLGPDAGTDYWRQWYVIWDATPGQHRLTARATDGNGEVQTAEPRDSFPSGATGYHQVRVSIG
jgi:DMSO/TMAO reductase YedYZ molybdopterin-dependent catalytic subunit